MTATLLTLLLFAARADAKQDPPPTPPPAATTTATGLAGDSSPLVKAAQEAKAKKKQSSSRKVITNKDLRSGKTLKTNALEPLQAVEVKPASPPEAPVNDDESRKARKAAEERLAAAEKRLAELEADLGRVEQSYYDENDVVRRDTVIREQFAQARRRLEEGRREAHEARDALAALMPKSGATVIAKP